MKMQNKDQNKLGWRDTDGEQVGREDIFFWFLE